MSQNSFKTVCCQYLPKQKNYKQGNELGYHYHTADEQQPKMREFTFP